MIRNKKEEEKNAFLLRRVVFLLFPILFYPVGYRILQGSATVLPQFVSPVP